MKLLVIASKLLKVADSIIAKLIGGSLERERYRQETGALSREGKRGNKFGKSGR